jgi:hypothetical protein
MTSLLWNFPDTATDSEEDSEEIEDRDCEELLAGELPVGAEVLGRTAPLICLQNE